MFYNIVTKEGEFMAKQIEGVYEEVIEIAKQEFLVNGFQKASLRTIATKANTTTSSIYTRFGDKDGLFSAIIEPTATKLVSDFKEVQENFHQLSKEIQREQVGEYTLKQGEKIIDFMYENFTECKLLLESAQGTKYENFVDEFVNIEEEYTRKYIECISCSISDNKKMDYAIIHMVTTAYFESFFEIIRHNIDKQEAKNYIKVLGKYHLSGFKAVFNIR